MTSFCSESGVLPRGFLVSGRQGRFLPGRAWTIGSIGQSLYEAVPSHGNGVDVGNGHPRRERGSG